MNAPAPDAGFAAADPGERALALFVSAGYPRVEPPILQPASAFLELVGEDIRSRLYLTTDPSGAELCLRPDYTIPVCRDYLSSARAGAPARFAYCGPVFRARAGYSGQSRQAGLESFGRRDAEAAEAEIVALSLEAVAETEALNVRYGDQRLFADVLRALRVPESWSRRLHRGLARGRSLDEIFERRNGGGFAQAGVLAALETADHAAAKSLVEDLLAIAGIETVGGRAVSEIADRFLDQATERAGGGVDDGARETIKRFLAIEAGPDEASQKLRAFAAEANVNLWPALDSFDQRVGFLAARGLDLRRFVFSSKFLRDLDYYTGFLFEAGPPGGRPIVGGGRYDALARHLGAKGDIPAVGAAIFLDRLGA